MYMYIYGECFEWIIFEGIIQVVAILVQHQCGNVTNANDIEYDVSTMDINDYAIIYR
jgi:hypothetical protein